ncbi:hypothetical protein M8C21_009756, partial [Ambrosia artemisiifolia]
MDFSSPSSSSSAVDNNILSTTTYVDDDDDEEEDVCRICRNTGDADNPLRYPCACSGSIKFVHQHCLLQWLDHSNARHCEVCKHPFSFSPVYAENAPGRLPFQEFIIAIAMKAYIVMRSLRDYLRHLRELGGQEGDREEELDGNGARLARRQGNPDLVGEENDEDVVGAQGIGGAGQLNRRNAENVAAGWEMQAARLVAHVEQMFDGLDDGDGAEDVPFDELVGMQPVFHLVENAFT